MKIIILLVIVAVSGAAASSSEETKRIEARKELESVAFALANELKDKAKFAGTIAYDDVAMMEITANNAIKWLQENQDADIEDYLKQKKTLVNSMETLISKLMQTASAASSINEPAVGDTKSKTKKAASTDEERIKARIDLKESALALKNQFTDKTKFTGTTAYKSIIAIENAAMDTIRWLDENHDAAIEDYLRQKKNLFSTVETLMSEVIQNAGAAPTNAPDVGDATIENESTSKTEAAASKEELEPEKDTPPTHSEQPEDKNEDKKRNERILARSEFEKAAYAIKDKLKDKEQFAGTSVYDSISMMENAAADAIKWLDENQDADIEDIQQQKRKFAETVETIAKKIIESQAAPTNPEEQRIQARAELGRVANAVKNSVKDKDKTEFAVAYEGLEIIENAATDAIKWLEENQDAETEDYEEQRKKLTVVVEATAQKIKDQQARSNFESAVNDLKKFLEDNEYFAYEEAKALENVAIDAIKWLDENQNADLKDYAQQHKTFVNTVETLKTKLIESAAAAEALLDEAELTVEEAKTESESISKSETENTGSTDERIKARQELETSAYKMKTEFGSMAELPEAFGDVSIKALENTADDVLKWLDENKDADLEDVNKQHEKLQQTIQTFMAKMVANIGASMPTILQKAAEAEAAATAAETESSSTEEIDAEKDETLPQTDSEQLRDEL